MSEFKFIEAAELASFGMDHDHDPAVVEFVKYILQCEDEIRRQDQQIASLKREVEEAEFQCGQLRERAITAAQRLTLIWDLVKDDGLRFGLTIESLDHGGPTNIVQFVRDVISGIKREVSEAHARGWSECREAAVESVANSLEAAKETHRIIKESAQQPFGEKYWDGQAVMARCIKEDLVALTPPSASDENRATLSAESEESNEQD